MWLDKGRGAAGAVPIVEDSSKLLSAGFHLFFVGDSIETDSGDPRLKAVRSQLLRQTPPIASRRLVASPFFRKGYLDAAVYITKQQPPLCCGA